MDTLTKMISENVNSLKLLCKQGVHFCYLALIEPRATSEDDSRHEFILNVILCGSTLILTLYLFIIIKNKLTLGHAYKGMPPLVFIAIYTCFILLTIFSRKGYFRIISHILIWIYFIATTYGAVLFGVELPMLLLTYTLIIAIASILVSTRYSFVVTVVICLTLALLKHLEIVGVIFPDNRWKFENEFLHVLEIIIMFGLIVTVYWLSNREIEKSLQRARKSEAELKHEKESLEIKVEERTKELKNVQLEKMSQLYRFAEFGRLSSGLFHDLINPLSIVSLNVNKLRTTDQAQTTEVKSYIDRAIKASTRMDNFMQSIKKQLQTQQNISFFSLNEEIDDVIEIFKYKARLNDVTLEFSADKDIETWGNALKFNQVVMNLISNAIDAYQEIHEGTYKQVRITIEENNQIVCLKVSDKGSGIQPEIMGKIFDPFFTTKSVHQGIGLGLSTTKDIIEKDFEGTISVRSDGNQGTVFIVKFPIKKRTSDKK
jgi:signal transduction histidine kinase